MRAVIQRVRSARVEVAGETVGEIGQGLLVLLGVGQGDRPEDAEWLADKTAELRVFADEAGKMNRSLADVGGSALVVSQFTLLGDCRKGRRPAFTAAAPPDQARELYEHFAQRVASRGVPVARGVFAADMQVHLINDGPVTLVIDRPDSRG